ncbi:MAG: FAD-binding oxidoreductase [Thermoanaerobaculia bacterium]|nr:FAD-binding oxidoreductase [Thermoanaerobaculia bacterium]
MASTREQRLSGWGGPVVPGRELLSEDLAAVARDAVLTRGLGRSYGDSSLPPPGVERLAGSRLADRVLGFDAATLRLRAEAGLSLADLAWQLLPRRLFLPVVPGTQYVTLGGMVAADVHGKNHHLEGTFGRHVDELVLLTAGGERVRCSRDENGELFRATLGGMGLTGHILEVVVRLVRVPSPWIVGETRRARGLDEFLAELAAAARAWPFTVGWIDCLAKGSRLGRGVLFRGRWATSEEAPRREPRPLAGPSVPFLLPNWALNDLSVRLFNLVYATSHAWGSRRRVVHPQRFFWPLDGVRQWNRIYGRRGFTQFQCVLPEHERPGAARRFLAAAVARGGASFLCVIKDCGDEGEGTLSFPRRGISIALDLPLRRETPALVEALGELVIAEGGRIYLAKDAYLRADQWRRMEPRLSEFERVRAQWDPERRLRSAQSVRLLGDPA